jgi:hypothetical protein
MEKIKVKKNMMAVVRCGHFPLQRTDMLLVTCNIDSSDFQSKR